MSPEFSGPLEWYENLKAWGALPPGYDQYPPDLNAPIKRVGKKEFDRLWNLYPPSLRWIYHPTLHERRISSLWGFHTRVWYTE